MNAVPVRKKHMWVLLWMMFFAGILCFPVVAAGAETGNAAGTNVQEFFDPDDLQEDILSEFSFDEIEDVLAEYESTRNMDFSDLLQLVLERARNPGASGEMQSIPGQIGRILFSDMISYKKIFVQILSLTIAFSFLNNFINVFENSQISRTGYYMFFLMMAVLLMKSYTLLNDTLVQVLGQITGFMQVVLPVFCMSMVFSASTGTAVAFYQIILTVIWLVERILLYMIVPAIHIYMVLQVLNQLTDGQIISRWTLLLKRGIVWSLRLLLAGVTGINIVENLIAPSADNLQKLSITKTLGMIPGLGGTAEAVSSVLIGSAAVIKNSIGVTAMILLLIICISPVLKLLLFSLFYRVAGAVVQPFADHRIASCIDGVGEAAGLLLKTLVTGALLFLISMAVVLTAAK